MNTKKMPTKVNFIDDKGKQECLWFGAACTPEEVEERLRHMKSLGWKILSHYKVKTMKNNILRRI
jgi:hypothetical protein